MKTGCLYVDGYDVFKQFGMYVVEGGYNDLIAFPPLKDVVINDWQEEDGIEVDLSAPVLNTREIGIKFAFSGVYSNLFKFLDILSDGAYHIFDCAEIGRTYKLRLIQQPNLRHNKILGFTTLKFADDFPLLPYTYGTQQEQITTAECADYSIDQIPVAGFGIRILKGTYDEILRASSVKQNLLRNLSHCFGAEYDEENVTYKSKDVKIQCLMRADTLNELWCNYDAFLHRLISPNEHLLGVFDLEKEFPFYYKKSNVTKFCATGRIWLQFTLTIAFTKDFRIDEEEFLLATESGILLFTEDDDFAIELLPNKFLIPSMRLVNNRATIRLQNNGSIRLNN